MPVRSFTDDELLKYIRDYRKKHGKDPLQTEAADHFGVKRQAMSYRYRMLREKRLDDLKKWS